jgi:hypothetical protein
MLDDLGVAVTRRLGFRSGKAGPVRVVIKISHRLGSSWRISFPRPRRVREQVRRLSFRVVFLLSSLASSFARKSASESASDRLAWRLERGRPLPCGGHAMRVQRSAASQSVCSAQWPYSPVRKRGERNPPALGCMATGLLCGLRLPRNPHGP